MRNPSLKTRIRKKVRRKVVGLVRMLLVMEAIGVRHYLQYILAKKGTELLVEMAGKSIVIRKGTPDLRVAFSCLTGEFECVRYLLPRTYRGVVVDAGGYIGASAIALRDLFPNAKIVVIEPSIDNIRILRKNCESIGNVTIVPGALVGKNVGSVELKNRDTGEWGYTTVIRPKDKSAANTLQESPAFTLSQLVAPNEEIGLLKLDIEGGELDVLRNDTSSLSCVKIILIELHDRIAEGCTEEFWRFSEGRLVIKDRGEKYLSIAQREDGRGRK